MPVLDVMDRHKATSYGGLLLVEALCRRWGLWSRIDEKLFPPVQDSFFGPRPAESIIAQMLFSLARGGTSVSEAAMLRDDPLALRLLGLKHAADEGTLNAWLTGQTETSLQALRYLNVEVVKSALMQFCPAKTEGKANPLDIVMRTTRWTISKETNSIVENGLPGLQLCWRSLAVGPFLLDGLWSMDRSGTENTAQFEELVTSHCSTWKEHETYFSSGDMPDGAAWRRVVDTAGFALWTAQLDDYTLYRAYNFDKDSQQLKWKEADSNDTLAQHYCMVYAGKDGRNIVPGVAAVARRREEGDLYRCRFLAVPTRPDISAQTFFARHFFVKLVADQMLDDLSLNRLLSLQGNARVACFVIASLAYNLLTAIRMLLMPQAQAWTTREIIRGIITTPLILSTSGRRDTGYLAVTPDWPAGWRELVESSMLGAGRCPPRGMTGQSETKD